MGQYANELYARNYSLECENKALRGQIEEFKNGQRYKKLAEGYGKVITRLTSIRELRRNLRRRKRPHRTSGIYGLSNVIKIGNGISQK